MKAGHSLVEYAVATVTTPMAWAGAVFALVLRAVVPSPELGAAIFGLVVLWTLDFALGLSIAWKDGVAWSSARMGDSLRKLGAYIVLPMAFSFMKLVTGYPDHGLWTMAIWGVVGACGGRELWSIIENSAKLGVKLGPKMRRALKGHVKLLADSDLEERKEN